MQTTRLGKTQLEVSRLALDCRRLGVSQRARGWDPANYDGEVFAIRTLHAALDAGINLFDSSPAADGGRGEALLGKALTGRRESALLTSELGRVENKDAPESRILATLRRLRADHLDIVYVDDQIGQRDCLLAPLARLRERGVVRFLGLNVSNAERAAILLASGEFDVATFTESQLDDPVTTRLAYECIAKGIGTGVTTPARGQRLPAAAPARPAKLIGDGDPDDNRVVRMLSRSCFDFVSLGLRWEHEVITSSREVAQLAPASVPLAATNCGLHVDGRGLR